MNFTILEPAAARRGVVGEVDHRHQHHRKVHK